MSWSSAAGFYHQLGVMLRAGLTISQAVEAAGRAGGGHHAERSKAWSAGCTAGRSLAEQLAEDGEEPLAHALVLAGERSGHLPELVEEIAQFNEHRMALRRLLIGRLVYPVVLIHVALAVPGVPSAWRDGSLWPILVGPLSLWGIAAVCWVLLLLSHRSGLGARLALLPGIRFLVAPLIAANTCLVLHATCKAGMLFHEGLEMAAGSCGNRAMAIRLQHAAREMINGRINSLAEALSACRMPPTVLQLVEAGEISGALESNLQRAGNYSREQFRERTTWATRIVSGTVYAIAMLLAAWTVLSMYSGMLGEAMQMAEGAE